MLSIYDVGVLWPNGWMDQDETWHVGRPQPWPHRVRCGPSSPSPKGHSPLQFSVHIRCGQMAGWIKMPLGMEVHIGLGDFVLNGDPAPAPPKGHSPHPIFGPYLLRPNGCMDQDATWYGARPQPMRLCVRWRPRSTFPKKGTEPLSQFSAHFY